jgi:hypothetical protein
LDFESREYELVQQENGVAKLFEPLEVEVYLYSSLKKLADGLRFKFRTMSGGAGHCSARPDIVRSKVSMKCI